MKKIVILSFALACGWIAYQFISIRQYEQKNIWKKSESGQVQFLDSPIHAELYVNPQYQDCYLVIAMDIERGSNMTLQPKRGKQVLFWLADKKEIDILDTDSYYRVGKNFVINEVLSGWILHIAMVDFEPDIKWTSEGVSFLAAPKQKVTVTYPSQ